MPKSWACPCGANNHSLRDECEKCRSLRPSKQDGKPPSRDPRICPVDGFPRQLTGYCDHGGGYSATWPCPFRCPHCGGELHWSGMCDSCSPRRREAVGDSYVLNDGHWRFEEKGPTPLATNEQARRYIAEINTLLAAKLTAGRQRQ